jgi:1-acyl-sn-glycerol-3-phosphate acyltransferase
MFGRLFRILALYLFHVLFVYPVLWGVIGARYRRREALPEGACLVVANHNSHLDAAVLMRLFPLRRLPHVRPVAAADYFGRNWLLRTMAMLFMNGIPIERNAAPGQDVLAPMIEALERGQALIFFPEGSRGEAGVVAPFRPGIGRLVRAMPGLRVVPVFMSGPERIWPRGRVVPVPLAIDVNVGRARTYAAELSSREIAEQVRRDVLALAPPPPPVPGPRPGPPVRIAVCGIDEQAREGLVSLLTERLGRVERSIGIADPMLDANEEGLRESPGPVPLTRSPAWLGLLARALRTGGRLGGSKFAELVERAAVDEALQHGRAARFVVGGGSSLVELLAWAEAHRYGGGFDEQQTGELMLYLSRERRIPVRRWWRYVRQVPEIWVLNVFDLARMLPPDVLVLLRGRMAGDREPLRLEDAYRKVAGVLRRRRHTEVLEFDAASTARDEIAEATEVACRRLLDRQGRAAPRSG